MPNEKGRPKGTGGQAKDLTKEDIERVEISLRGTRYEKRDMALIHLGLGSGMRIGEMVGLDVGRIVDENGIVLKRIVLDKHQTKTKKSREIYLSDQAVYHLQKHVDGLKYKEQNDPIFSTQVHPKKFMKANIATNLVRKIFRRAGIKGAATHSLRRTHANALRRNGTDLQIISDQLGHSSLAVTSIYFRTDPAERESATKNLRF